MGIFNPDNKGIIKISSLGNTRLSSLTDDFMKRLGYVRCDKDGTPTHQTINLKRLSQDAEIKSP